MDKNKDIFDVIILSQIRPEKVTIPSFIKKINQYAFTRSNNLRAIDIPTNSELQIVEEGVFEFTNIKSIFLPAHLNQVCEGLFDDCNDLQIIEIDQNSELDLAKIGKFSGIIMVPAKLFK